MVRPQWGSSFHMLIRTYKDRYLKINLLLKNQFVRDAVTCVGVFLGINLFKSDQIMVPRPWVAPYWRVQLSHRNL